MLDHLNATDELVRLRMTHSGDEAILGDLLTDPVTRANAGLQLPDPTDQASWQWALTTLVTSHQFLLIIARQNDQAAGVISLTQVGPQQVEIGYLLAPTLRGRGLMTAAVSLLEGELTKQKKPITLLANTDIRNRPSMNVLRRTGFQKINPVKEDKMVSWQWTSKKN